MVDLLRSVRVMIATKLKQNSDLKPASLDVTRIELIHSHSDPGGKSDVLSLDRGWRPPIWVLTRPTTGVERNLTG
jgi:hypothetical protein